jgi:hypothetical protein
MAHNQSISQEKPNTEKTIGSTDVPEPSVIEDSPVENSGLHSVIDDEVLRSRIRKLIDEKPSPSTFQQVSTNPLTSIIIGFLLTGLIGGFLTYYYNRKQKELETQRTIEQQQLDRLREEQQQALDRKREDERRESDRLRADQQRESDRLYQERQKDIEHQRALQQRESERLRDIRQKELERERSFADELNKTRVAKIGEVWEKLNLYEAATDVAVKELEQAKKTIDKKWGDYLASNLRSNHKGVPVTGMDGWMVISEEYREQLQNIVNKKQSIEDGVLEVLNRNRFWIGETEFLEIRSYIEITDEYVGATFFQAVYPYSKDNQNRIKDLSERREKLRQDIIIIRKKLLGIP